MTPMCATVSMGVRPRAPSHAPRGGVERSTGGGGGSPTSAVDRIQLTRLDTAAARRDRAVAQWILRSRREICAASISVACSLALDAAASACPDETGGAPTKACSIRSRRLPRRDHGAADAPARGHAAAASTTLFQRCAPSSTRTAFIPTISAPRRSRTLPSPPRLTSGPTLRSASSRPKDDCARVHASSGTTGSRRCVGYTRDDLADVERSGGADDPRRGRRSRHDGA